MTGAIECGGKRLAKKKKILLCVAGCFRMRACVYGWLVCAAVGVDVVMLRLRAECARWLRCRIAHFLIA